MKRVLILFLIFGFCQMAFASRRALVIGNSDYSERPLRNPVADAELMCASLEELGFTVTKVLNADRNRFNREVNQFSQTVQAEDEIVFFYSGHGLQVNGSNYLLPICEYFNDELDVEHKAVSLNLITEKLSRAKITLVFLDACRDNPYLMTRGGAQGLATVGTSRNDTFVMFSTAAGAVANDGSGQNSEFSRSLAANILVPGLSIDEISYRVSNDVSVASNGMQRPWRTNNIQAPYYFSNPQDTAAGSQSTPLYVENYREPTPSMDPPLNRIPRDSNYSTGNHVLRNLRFLSSTEYLSMDIDGFERIQTVSRNLITLKIPWFGIEAEYNLYQNDAPFFDDDRVHEASQLSIGIGLPDPEEMRLFAKVATNKRLFAIGNDYWEDNISYKDYISYSAEFAKRVRSEHQLSELFIRYQHNDFDEWMIPEFYYVIPGHIYGKISSRLPKDRVEIGAFLCSITNFYNEPVEYQGVSLDSRPLMLMSQAGALLSARFIAESNGDTKSYGDYSTEQAETFTGAEIKLPIKFSRYFGVHFGFERYQAKYYDEYDYDNKIKETQNNIMGGVSLSLLDFSFIKLTANADYVSYGLQRDDYKSDYSYLSWSPILFIRPWKGLAIYAHYKNGGYGSDISGAMDTLGDESSFGVGMTLRL